MSNVVNFSTLKRREIKCIIFENKEGKIVVENNNEKIKILEENKLENPIIIYNPDQNQKGQIQKMIANNISKEEGNVEINPEDLILNLLPLTSNIILDLHRDNEKDMEIIKEIISDPAPIFEKAINIIKEIIKEIGNQYISTINEILEMSDEQREKLFNKSNLSEKELKKQELERQLKELNENN